MFSMASTQSPRCQVMVWHSGQIPIEYHTVPLFYATKKPLCFDRFGWVPFE